MVDLGMTPVDDRVTLTQIKAGFINAYGIVFAQYSEEIYRFVRTQVPNEAVASEVTEAAFVQAWFDLAHYDINNQPILNFLWGHARKALRHYKHRLGDTSQANDNNEFSELNKLPLIMQEVLVLRYFNLFTLEETAEILGMKPIIVNHMEHSGLGWMRRNAASRQSHLDIVKRFRAQREDSHTPFRFLQIYGQRVIALLRIADITHHQRGPVPALTAQPATSKFWAVRRLAMKTAVSLALVIFTFLSVGGVAFAAQSSLPGDHLYPAKLAVEDVRLALANDDTSLIQLHVDFALERIQEVEALLAASEPGGVDGALADFFEHQECLEDMQGQVAATPNSFLSDQLILLDHILEQHVQLLVDLDLGLSSQTLLNLNLALENISAEDE